jgi:hypothetical protein
MKNWLARRREIGRLCLQVIDLNERILQRGELIAQQDAEITRLRTELKEAAKQAEYWQAKAVNP